MLQQSAIKGFTTVKFVAGCWLIYFLLHGLFLFYTIWDDEQQTFKKIIYFLICAICLGLIILFKIPTIMKAFVLGAGRYNQLRYVDQSKSIPSKGVKSSNSIEESSIIEPRVIKNKNQVKMHEKVKKHHSYEPADFLAMSVKPELLANHRKSVRSLSVSMPYSDDYEFQANLNRIRGEQLKMRKLQYARYLKLKGLDQRTQRIKIDRARSIIGKILLQEIRCQQQNLQDLVFKVHNMFDMRLVQKKDKSIPNWSQKTNYTDQVSSNAISSSLFANQQQVQIDQIIENYVQGNIERKGYKLMQKCSQSIQAKRKAFQEVSEVISQRLTLDKRINFNQAFTKHSSRKGVINMLKILSRHYTQNKPIANLEQKSDLKMEEFEQKHLQVWVISHHFNELLKCKLDEATICLEDQTLFYGRQNYIKWLLAPIEVLVHYDQVHNYNFSILDCKKATFQQACLPGEDNIPSLIVNYLNLIKRQFESKLQQVPEIQAYTLQIWV